MKKRDRRIITPYRASLTVGQSSKTAINIVESRLDDWFCDAVPENTGPSEKMIDTSSAFYLNGEGTSKNKEMEKEEEKSKSESKSGNKDKHYDRIISSNHNIKNMVSVFGPDKKRLKNTNENRAKKWIKQKNARQVKDKSRPDAFAIQLIDKPVGNVRVPVLAPDGALLMPTKSSRARKWLRDGKAKVVTNDLNIFQIQLIEEPSGRNKQPVVLLNDPGSRFTGVVVCSKKDILYGCNLELIADEKENRFASIKYRNDKRRELRRSRRHRNCRRRECRFLNRSKTGKMAPSIRSRKQLELRVDKELCKVYPITIIGIEDIKFDHYNKRWGKNFSQVEVGKKWLYEELKKIPEIKEVELIKGYETNIRREQLGLKKSGKKDDRNQDAHINDCIAMGSIILGLGMETKTILRPGINFDIITRPKYSRRKLHNEQPSKGGIRRRFGGTTTDWTNIRKGDYVEAIIDKRDCNMLYRGWIAGFDNDNKLISVYNFDWKRIGQFDYKKVRLLNRNNGLLVRGMEMEENRLNICKYGTVQENILDAW